MRECNVRQKLTNKHIGFVIGIIFILYFILGWYGHLFYLEYIHDKSLYKAEVGVGGGIPKSYIDENGKDLFCIPKQGESKEFREI